MHNDPASLLAVLPHEPFLRSLLIQGGVSRRQLDRLVGSGLLRQPIRGVLVRADQPDTIRQRAAAAGLVLPKGAAVCRTAAAWLHGIDARPPGAHLDDPPLECAVPVGSALIRRAGIVCYTTDLIDDDVTEVFGVPCVSPERTAIDLARWAIPGIGLGALDAMTRAGMIDPEGLLGLIERWHGDRFVARARQLLHWCDPRAESFGESCLRLLDAGFPVPDVQVSLTDAEGIERRRLDLGYVEELLGLEYDGELYHSGLEAEAADRRRCEEIRQIWGWTVLGFRKSLVLGPSMAIERGVGEILGVEPRIRRRSW